MSDSTADPCRDRQRVQPRCQTDFFILFISFLSSYFFSIPYLMLDETIKIITTSSLVAIDYSSIKLVLAVLALLVFVARYYDYSDFMNVIATTRLM
jgi:hypothetical protein